MRDQRVGGTCRVCGAFRMAICNHYFHVLRKTRCSRQWILDGEIDYNEGLGVFLGSGVRQVDFYVTARTE